MMDTETSCKKFPTLNGKIEDGTIPTYPDDTIMEDGYVEINDIYKYCLDKQKVKKALAFVRTLNTCDEATCKIIEKELRLE